MSDAGTPNYEMITAGGRFAVDPKAVERELAAAWQAAGQSSTQSHPVTRACLWNVIVHIEERPEHFDSSRKYLSKLVPRITEPQTSELIRNMITHQSSIGALMRDLPKHLASRALILKTRNGVDPQVQSWISANCILDDSGGKLICSEEITLESYGEGWKHLPSLVRALLVPGIPTAVVFPFIPPERDDLANALIQIGDRVVSYAHSSHPPGMLYLSELKAGRSQADLTWTSQTQLRRGIASLFDSYGNQLPTITRVEGRGAKSCAGDVALAMGWVASCLGAIEVTKRDDSMTEIQTQRGSIQFDSIYANNRKGLEITFYTGSGQLKVAIESNGSLSIDDGTGTSRRDIGGADEAQLLANTLLTPPGGPSYEAAIVWARRLYI